MLLKVPLEVLNLLRQLGRSERTTLFTLLLAAFNVLLFRFTGQSDILVGTPIANRRQIELEHLIGFFLNTLVLRNDLSGNPSFRQLLKQVNSVVLDAFDHQDLPFERLVEDVKPDRDLSRHPLFQIAFVLQPAGVRDFHLSGIEVERIRVEYGWSKFDLTLFMIDGPDGLVVIL